MKRDKHQPFLANEARSSSNYTLDIFTWDETWFVFSIQPSIQTPHKLDWQIKLSCIVLPRSSFFETMDYNGAGGQGRKEMGERRLRFWLGHVRSYASGCIWVLRKIGEEIPRQAIMQTRKTEGDGLEFNLNVYNKALWALCCYRSPFLLNKP